MSLTKKDLQDITKAIGAVIDKKNLATKSFTREYLDEVLANFRLSLNKDMSKFATKVDLEEFATKKDLQSLKTELKEYIHEVGDQIVNGFSDTMEEHLQLYHDKVLITTH